MSERKKDRKKIYLEMAKPKPWILKYDVLSLWLCVTHVKYITIPQPVHWSLVNGGWCLFPPWEKSPHIKQRVYVPPVLGPDILCPSPVTVLGFISVPTGSRCPVSLREEGPRMYDRSLGQKAEELELGLVFLKLQTDNTVIVLKYSLFWNFY